MQSHRQLHLLMQIQKLYLQLNCYQSIPVFVSDIRY